MHSLGVPTSRSLSLYVSKSENVKRPWYSEGSRSKDPDMLISEPVAISTRVAPSFIRVGQLELFGRRARKNEHPKAMQELEKIVLHAIEREYADVIDNQLSTAEKVLMLAREFRSRLTSLVANWIRVGFCQGNFNSDNCSVGGFTLDYGPFGFCDVYDPHFQSWTGGGHHFSFMNQPVAAQQNFKSFCNALRPLLASYQGTLQHEPSKKNSLQQDYLQQLDEIQDGFSNVMQAQMEKMWAGKLGLSTFNKALFSELESLMAQTPVDYTLFFRELSMLPENIAPLKKSFYKDSEDMDLRWSEWLAKWKSLIASDNVAAPRSDDEISSQMKLVNPKYILREWFVVPAYQQATAGNYALVRELQEIMTQPYAEQSKEIEDKYYRLKPFEFFELGGTSYYSCSS
jgi:uncharacterized protein YdiU (UPF0061 family)